MIWESRGLMTALDLTIIAMGLGYFVVFSRHLERSHRKGFWVTGAGLLGFGLFYLVDLFAMWVLPHLTSPDDAMVVMETLHLNYHWGFMLFGMAVMVWGFSHVGRHLTNEVSERKRAEEALRVGQERFQLAADGSNAGLWDWPNMTEATQWWSPRWYELLGYTDGELEASHTNFKRLLHPDDKDRLVEAVRAHHATGRPLEVEYRLRTKSGEYRWFLGRAQSRKDERTKACRMSGSIQDITDRKQAEERQRALDDRLRETQKLETVGVFARGFAHDFNNLLTSVMGNASFALVTLPSSSPLRSHMDAIEQAASHGAALTQQLLAFAGEGRGLPDRFSVSTIVEETKPLLAATVPDGVRLKYELASGLPSIVADPTHMRQVLVNLVANAAHAIAADGVVTIRTGTLSVSPDDTSVRPLGHTTLRGPSVYLEVADTGGGMDDRTQAKMWDPFFSARPGGRGLGLAVVHGVVRSQNGGVRVVSRLGAGTTIQVVFPVAPIPSDLAAEATSGGSAGGEPDASEPDSSRHPVYGLPSPPDSVPGRARSDGPAVSAARPVT